MKSFVVKNRHHGRCFGFTLVEMLVVIAIMSILMTAGAIGLGGTSGKGVTSGVASSESLFDEARNTAMSKSLRSCILVAKTLTNNSGDNLRRIIVAYEETDTDGRPKKPNSAKPDWVISSRGLLLPDQTFFSMTFSKKDHAGTGDLDEITATRIVDSSGSALKATSPYIGTYFIYEFSSEGICTTPGASFVIGSGTRGLTASALAGPPKVTAAALRDFGGFVVWRSGSTSVFRSPEQISTQFKSITPGTVF
jgi:prepilin-type N-terminal cleavage/methylation domain-containing protein